jgi:hypothetical protein
MYIVYRQLRSVEVEVEVVQTVQIVEVVEVVVDCRGEHLTLYQDKHCVL